MPVGVIAPPLAQHFNLCTVIQCLQCDKFYVNLYTAGVFLGKIWGLGQKQNCFFLGTYCVSSKVLPTQFKSFKPTKGYDNRFDFHYSSLFVQFEQIKLFKSS